MANYKNLQAHNLVNFLTTKNGTKTTYALKNKMAKRAENVDASVTCRPYHLQLWPFQRQVLINKRKKPAASAFSSFDYFYWARGRFWWNINVFMTHKIINVALLLFLLVKVTTSRAQTISNSKQWVCFIKSCLWLNYLTWRETLRKRKFYSFLFSWEKCKFAKTSK